MKPKLSLLLLFLATTVAADETRLRELLAKVDYDAMVAAYDAETTHSVSERALYVAALERVGARGRADDEATKLRDEHPDDAWAWYAVVTTAETPEALKASEKMMQLAGDRADPLMVRLRARELADSGKRDEAAAFLATQPHTPFTLVTRATTLAGGATIDAQYLADLDEALKIEPNDIEALYWKGEMLRFEKRNADALPFLEKAASLTDAKAVLLSYWRVLRTQNPDQVRPSIEAALARSPNSGLMMSASMALGELGDKEKARELQDRVLREAPASVAAQWVLNQRFLEAEGADRLKAAREYVAWPAQYDPWLLANGYRVLFLTMSVEPVATVSDEELLTAIHGMQAAARDDYPDIAITLANRKLALTEAEKFARDAMPRLERLLDELRARNVPHLEESMSSRRAEVHDALGWVLLQEGKTREAQKELLAAYELQPKRNPLIPYHLGRLYESQKKFSKAEAMFRRGYLMQSPRANPNVDALKALYQKRFGSLDGFDESLKQAKTFDAESRRKEILAACVTKTLPPFKLKTLDGKAMTPDDLKGKVAVINFWGIWCGWCVREMPDYQALAKKYAKDDKVAILTINNDEDAAKVRKWMTDQKYSLPVLLDNGYAHQHVRGYPTTWFIDPAGKIRFEKSGWSQELVEEFSWRIEALR